MKIVTLLLIYFNSLILAFSQEAKITRSINWMSPVFIAPESSHPHLRFAHAVYNDPVTMLPYYSELLPFQPGDQEYAAIISKAEYVQVDSSEAKILSFIKLDSMIKPSCERKSSRNQDYLEVAFIPLRYNPANGKLEKLLRFQLIFSPCGPSLKSMHLTARNYATHSLLSTGKWLKVKLDKSGIYKLSYDQLKQMGFNNPRNIRVFGNGGTMLSVNNYDPRIDDLQEIPLRFMKGSDNTFGSGDFMIFYAGGVVNWNYDANTRFYYHNQNKYSDFAYYFLTEDMGLAQEIPVSSAATVTPDHDVITFDDYAFHELDLINLIKSGSEWYGETFDLITSYDFRFSFQNISPTDSAYIYARLLARNSTPTTFTLKLNGQFLHNLYLPDVDVISTTDDYASIGSVIAGLPVTSNDLNLNITFNKSGMPAAQGWLDFVDVNVRRQMKMSGPQFMFRCSQQIGTGKAGRFVITNAPSSLSVWDVTDIHNPSEIPLTWNGQNAEFVALTETIREYVAFDLQADYPSPVTDGDDAGWLKANQDLHSIQEADLVIVTHPLFLVQADSLAQIHRDQDKMNVVVATTTEVYNEFSSGAPDVTAIKDFIKMIYDKGKISGMLPSYLLLFGDGSYDNKNKVENNPNFILTYQSPNSINPTGSFVSDDYFGLLDDNEGKTNGLLDIGIGRLPVKSIDEAKIMLQKIKQYTNPANRQDWHNIISFIGDDGDNNIHMSQADQLAEYIEANYPGFEIEKIYLDAYQQVTTATGQSYPDVERAILQRIKKGGLIINYTGHGNEIGLSHEKILQDNAIKSLNNQEKLPLFITATCEFSRFDDVKITSLSHYDDATSAGEHLLLNPEGGGIALLSTTRLVYSGPNFTLNEKFYQYVFKRDGLGQKYRLGDIIRFTKNASGTGINKLNFTLLGDPALKLAYPEYAVITDSINNTPSILFKDTLKAYSLVSLSGHIADLSGNLLYGYNGLVNPVVFDKVADITTLNNDGTGAFNFETYNSILFRGKASVVNGRFRFSYIIPKDINYSIGPGKIIYYGNSNLGDANGYQYGMLIGGLETDPSPDTQGPMIRLFMNDTTFRNGGITDENPVLLAYLSDESGINTTGTGIGHDITLSLDDGERIYANDYYESETNYYNQGTVRYPFSGLALGRHKIYFKLWDIYNNSSDATIDLVVVSSRNIVLTDLLNYPNPFTSQTWFEFKHNRPGENLKVRIEIFSMAGQLVRVIETNLLTEGYGSPPISWDGTDSNGQLLRRGIYIYRVSIHTTAGEMTEKSGKLMLIR